MSNSSRLLPGIKRRVSRVSSHCKKGNCDGCYMTFCTHICHDAVDPASLRARLPKHTWRLAALVLRTGPQLHTTDKMAARLGVSRSTVLYAFTALYDATGMDTRRELWEFLDSRRAELKFLETILV